jgi:hypothetical protein
VIIIIISMHAGSGGRPCHSGDTLEDIDMIDSARARTQQLYVRAGAGPALHSAHRSSSTSHARRTICMAVWHQPRRPAASPARERERGRPCQRPEPCSESMHAGGRAWVGFRSKDLGGCICSAAHPVRACDRVARRY